MSPMLDMPTLGSTIATERRRSALTQSELARRAGVSRATIAALEGGTTAELGFVKVTRILAVLGLALRLSTPNAGRPTLEDLQAESEAEAETEAGRRR